MTGLTSAQALFFQSAIQNAIRGQRGVLKLRILRADDSIAAELSSESSETDFVIQTDGRKTGEHIVRGNAAETALKMLTEHGSRLTIDDGRQAVRLGVQKGKLTRETLPSQAAELKTPMWAVGKATHLDPREAAPLLQTIGLMTPEGEIKAPMRKKFKQVNHFLDLMAPILKRESPNKVFTLADCGCGKSYLSFVLFWYLRRVLNRNARFYGADTSENVIEESRRRAEQLQLDDMRFECAAIREAQLPDQIDLLVSLHACDTATDEALAAGAARGARALAAAPCCQHEFARQIQSAPHYPISRHTLFKHRFADLLTDMARSLFLEAHGYTVAVGEFVSVEETPKNLLLRAELGNANAEQRAREYQRFKEAYGVSPSIDALWMAQTSRI
ncbi:MAG: methyltransferase [bacterium]|nr:methyltransferase [bacterium]